MRHLPSRHAVPPPRATKRGRGRPWAQAAAFVSAPVGAGAIVATILCAAPLLAQEPLEGEANRAQIKQ